MEDWHSEYEQILHIDDDGSTYQWAAVALFRRIADGVVFWAQDAGCSCNYPFDSQALVDLQPLAGHEIDFINAASDISKLGHEKAQEALLALRNGRLTP